MRHSPTSNVQFNPVLNVLASKQCSLIRIPFSIPGPASVRTAAAIAGRVAAGISPGGRSAGMALVIVLPTAAPDAATVLRMLPPSSPAHDASPRSGGRRSVAAALVVVADRLPAAQPVGHQVRDTFKALRLRLKDGDARRPHPPSRHADAGVADPALRRKGGAGVGDDFLLACEHDELEIQPCVADRQGHSLSENECNGAAFSGFS